MKKDNLDVIKLKVEIISLREKNKKLLLDRNEFKKQLNLHVVSHLLTDKKTENLLNKLDNYARTFDCEFGLPLYNNVDFTLDYKGKQPIEELKDLVKQWVKVNCA